MEQLKSKRQKQVMAYLKVRPATQKEVERAYNDRVYGIRPRFAELERRGLIVRVGKRLDPDTGKFNIVWAAVRNAEPRPGKKKTLKEKKREALMILNRIYGLEGDQKFMHLNLLEKMIKDF